MDRLFEQSALGIGGVGGSGTRGIAAAFQSAGFSIGADLNESLDDLSFTVLLKDPALWPPENNSHVIRTRLLAYLSTRTQARFIDDKGLAAFRAALPEPDETRPWMRRAFQQERLTMQQHRLLMLQSQVEANPRPSDTGQGALPSTSSNIAADAIGGQPTSEVGETEPSLLVWKEPNTHILLPVLLKLMPDLRYLHVTRHGLDMAFSANQNQLKLWGDLLLGRSVNGNNPQDSFDYWCCVHNRLLAMRELFPDRVQFLNLESSCSDVDRVTDLIQQLLADSCSPELTARLARTMVDTIIAPDSKDRYKRQNRLSVSTQQQDILERFGYRVDY